MARRRRLPAVKEKFRIQRYSGNDSTTPGQMLSGPNFLKPSLLRHRIEPACGFLCAHFRKKPEHIKQYRPRTARSIRKFPDVGSADRQKDKQLQDQVMGDTGSRSTTVGSSARSSSFHRDRRALRDLLYVKNNGLITNLLEEVVSRCRAWSTAKVSILLRR